MFISLLLILPKFQPTGTLCMKCSAGVTFLDCFLISSKKKFIRSRKKLQIVDHCVMGACHEIFGFRFFSGYPQAPENPKRAGVRRQSCRRIIDTGGNLRHRWENLPPVSLILGVHLTCEYLRKFSKNLE